MKILSTQYRQKLLAHVPQFHQPYECVGWNVNSICNFTRSTKSLGFSKALIYPLNYEVVMQRHGFWFHPYLQIIFSTQELKRCNILQNRTEPKGKKKTLKKGEAWKLCKKFQSVDTMTNIYLT